MPTIFISILKEINAAKRFNKKYPEMISIHLMSNSIGSTRHDFKGQCHEIFDTFYIKKNSSWAPYESTKTVLLNFSFVF